MIVTCSIMKKIIENKHLVLQYKKGYGAWTYHLVIPGTASLEGKWGDLKVSGRIDDYELSEMNLAPRGDQDKMISVNKTIRESIGKTGGDMVTVTLFLHSKRPLIDKAEVIKCFEDAGVKNAFLNLDTHKRDSIIEQLTSLRSEELLIKNITLIIDDLTG